MYKISLIYTLLIISVPTFAGTKKIYYDKGWKECKKKSAAWFRLYDKEDTLYKIEDHYADGAMYMTGYCSSVEEVKSQYREGYTVFYDHSGHKLREGTYVHGIRRGLWKTYFSASDFLRSETVFKSTENEQIDSELMYSAVTHLPEHKTVYAPGKTKKWSYHNNDTIFREEVADANMPTQPNKYIPVICTYVESMPAASFNMPEYLKSHLTYPEKARRAGKEGKVIVKFTIDEDGIVSNAFVEKGFDKECDEAARKLVADMPRWKPGKQNGVPVRCYFTLPIHFKLAN